MNTQNTPLAIAKWPLALLLFLLAGCSTFPKAVKELNAGRLDTAEELFEKSLDHSTYGPGAEYYLLRLQINKNPNARAWIGISDALCDAAEAAKRHSPRQVIKLKRYEASRSYVIKARERLQRRIVDSMSRSGLIGDLLALEASDSCWSPGAVDSLRRIIVNKHIDPRRQVFDTRADKEWRTPPLPPDTRDGEDPATQCQQLTYSRSGISYRDVTTIWNDYPAVVLPQNYEKLWDLEENIWSIFRRHEPFCAMDRFKAEHPDNEVAKDCWFDAAHEALCAGELRPLLDFHRNNPHTVLDITVCLQIYCLASLSTPTPPLSPAENRQLEDVRSMVEIRDRLMNCEPDLDLPELLAQVADLTRRYPHHQLLYDLAQRLIDYGIHQQSELGWAATAVETLQPLFPDSAVCTPGFLFQVGKQAWFDGMAALLQQARESPITLAAAEEWNTPDHDEYTLVSWGGTDEVFFVRRNRASGKARVMSSLLRGKTWTKPVAVNNLSVADDVELLSISSGGRTLLLRSDGQLFQSFRSAPGRPWSKPAALSISKKFANYAWISPNDSLLLMEFYTTTPEADYRPSKDIVAARLLPNGTYGEAVSIGAAVNTGRFDEGAPIMALQGRTLFFTSDNYDGVGRQDIYSITLDRPWAWSSLGDPQNLGFPLNGYYDDAGLTYFSEYTNQAYLHREDRCREDTDIWRVTLGPAMFPEVLRLAGLILDENGEPLREGFVEFTPNYQLNVHSEPVSEKGTYTYTVEDSTATVRLFPEVPGYYSERDTVHFLANAERGEIIRDTFYVTSFEHIRQNFELIHSTFLSGTVQFDTPHKAYPELTRLAKIATRMGAILELTGHTDGSGTEARNLELSKDRAEFVKQFLVEKCGFPADRIKAIGYGAANPDCPNDTEAGRRCNRRVKVVFRMPELPGTPAAPVKPVTRNRD